MKKMILIMSAILISLAGHSQTGKILSESETTNLFSKTKKSDFGIKYPIFRTYEYSDKMGDHYMVFTEKLSKKNDAIEGFNLSYGISGDLIEKWKMKDFTTKEESTMWFWTKYVSFKDLDNDGFADPILVYGSHGINQYDDGRVKILVYYNDEKYAIRHQNSVSDYGRKTQVDATFYQLPQAIQTKVKAIMTQIELKNQSIFPANWKQNMALKKTLITE